MLCSVAQSCPTLFDPMDCSPPGPSIHGILQARTLERIAMPFSRGSSRPRDPTQVSHIAGSRFYMVWATREASKCYLYDVVPSYPWRVHYKIPQWTLEAAVSTTPCANHVLSYTDRRAGGPSGETMTSDPVGQSRAVWEFIMQLGTSYNLRFMNSLFLEFSISYFQTVVDRGWPQVTKAI